jgi:hypothetical protein
MEYLLWDILLSIGLLETVGALVGAMQVIYNWKEKLEKIHVDC